MTENTNTPTKRLTQKDVDDAYKRLAAKVREEYRAERTVAMNDPEAVLDKIEKLERVLATHMSKQVGKHPWVFQGFDIKANPNAVALWPITAKLLFTHTKHVGYESAKSWGESGSDIAFEWLKFIGFDIADVELIMNQPIND